MNKIAFALVGLMVLSLPVQAGKFIQAEHPLSGRYLVVLAPEAVRPASTPPTAPGRPVANLVSELALVHGGVAERVFEHALQGGVIAMAEGRARAMARDPRVAWVEEDGELQAFATDLVLGSWWVDRIDERDRPLNNHFTYTKNGAGVRIYVIDTGVADSYGGYHFGSRLVNAYSTVRDGSGNMVFGDPIGHGTKVAVHAASQYEGVARGASVQAVRVGTTSCTVVGGGNGEIPAYQGACFTVSSLVEAINWVAGHRVTPAVANLSLGGSITTTLETAVRGMVNANVTTVVAAGNSNSSACNVSPARMPEVITVGATNQSDVRSSFSNFGSCVTLFAPGEGVYSGESGTSFASPIVAGIAAKYLQGSPSAAPSAVKTYLVNNSTTGRITNAGAGSPNRLAFAPPGGTEVDNPPTPNFTFSCVGRTCSFTSTSTDDFKIIGCYWNWGHAYDWQPDQDCSLSHLFPSGGTFSVTLSTLDDAIQGAQKVKNVTVN